MNHLQNHKSKVSNECRMILKPLHCNIHTVGFRGWIQFVLKGFGELVAINVRKMMEM